MATNLHEYRIEQIERQIFKQSEAILACERNLLESHQINKQNQDDIKKLFYAQKSLTINIEKHKNETDKKLEKYFEELNAIKTKLAKQESGRIAVQKLSENWKAWFVIGCTILAAVSSLIDAGIFEFLHRT